MEYVKVPIETLKPAEYNPRKALTPRNKEYREIKKSIETFGYIDPILINKDGTIIGGHQRYAVLKDLGYKEIEVTRVDLPKDKEKALNVALNKITGRWDSALLKNVLEDLNGNGFDLSLTGFEPNVLDFGIRGDAEHTQKDLVEAIFNLEKADYYGVGKYDIPEIKPVVELPEIREWIGFNYVLSDKEPEGKAVHFFIDDYQFERVWNNPDKYIDKLKRYVCVASPDFSPYGDMPLATQIFNHFRKHWVARYMQEHGVTVIPTIRASSDTRSLEWFTDGEPKNSIVVYSSMWGEGHDWAGSLTMADEWNAMVERLSPSKVFVYGKIYELFEESGIPLERIEKFTEKRFKKGRI